MATTIMSSDRKYVITSSQCRAARSLLGITQGEFAKLGAVGTKTVADFERGVARELNLRTYAAIRAAFENAGIEFLEDDGVVLREPTPAEAMKIIGKMDSTEFEHALNYLREKYGWYGEEPGVKDLIEECLAKAVHHLRLRRPPGPLEQRFAGLGKIMIRYLEDRISGEP